MSELVAAAKAVKDREDFVVFLSKLSNDLKADPGSWENRDLDSYLEALVSWIEDMDGYYQNTGRELPRDVKWHVFADALMAARIYE
jgi:hypothetical protein